MRDGRLRQFKSRPVRPAFVSERGLKKVNPFGVTGFPSTAPRVTHEGRRIRIKPRVAHFDFRSLAPVLSIASASWKFAIFLFAQRFAHK